VLLQHNEAALDEWRHTPADARNTFLIWFEEHPLEITTANPFYRAQYEQKSVAKSTLEPR
jgi:hypothetical protein